MGAGRPVAVILEGRRVASGLSISINADGGRSSTHTSSTDRPEEVEAFMPSRAGPTDAPRHEPLFH